MGEESIVGGPRQLDTSPPSFLPLSVPPDADPSCTRPKRTCPSPGRALKPESFLVIYGVSLLAGSMLAGLFLGDLLGAVLGVQANVGGVGLAMVILILASDGLRRRGRLTPLTEQGVLFWSAIYIPVVVAMAAKQNVIAAVKGGPAAILAGVGAVVLSFLLVPLLSRIGQEEDGGES